MKLPLLGLLLVGTLYTQAQERYPVTAIPDSLLKNANCIKRMEDLRFEIRKLDQTRLYHTYALTILNEKGEDQAQLAIGYDKLHEVTGIEGSLYDAAGKLIRKLKPKEIQDYSNVDNNNLIDDNRTKAFSFNYRVYPYTVEFETVSEYKNSLFFPGWTPIEDEHYAVQSSRFSVTTPESYQFRYKAFNYPGAPIVTNEKGLRTTTWTVSGQKAMEYEFGMPSWYEVNTAVLLGPSDFQIQNYTGNMTDWASFGKFVYALKANRDVLPDATRQKVKELVQSAPTTEEKIRRLYAFMQNHTRYVSIQLGIGGWQPFEAAFVATKGYGDCKALTNYMYSLLKEAGIPSYYALIKAGRNAADIVPDFATQQFNHVILCVPVQTDTVWLECTSQTEPAGYLGAFTGNRYALLVSEQGGQLVRTPVYDAPQNRQYRTVQAQVLPDGQLKVSANTTYSGIQQEQLHYLLNNTSPDKVKDYLREELDFSTYEVARFKYDEQKSRLPVITESLDLQVSHYATITGKRLFLTPNIMTRSHRKLSTGQPRQYPLRLGLAFHDADTVTITIPDGYEIESTPAPVSLTTPFGRFSASVKKEGSQVRYLRNYEHYSGTYPAADYVALAAFYEAIYKADRARLVLVKKTE